jgi:hypothetical protein
VVIGHQPHKAKEQYDMKYLKIAFGLALVAGLMAVVASPALAAQPKWVACQEVTSGKWTNNNCTTAGSGKFETKAVTETVEVTSSSPGGLELEDSKATGGATAIKCEGSDLGTVGNEGSDSITKITATKCTFVKAGSCESGKAATARALNLPWATKLEEVGKEVRDQVTSLVSGKEPGWAVECTVLGVFKITDECTGNTSTGIHNVRNEGKVEAVFDKVTEEKPATCSVGGAKSGFVRGVDLSLLTRWHLYVLAPALGG